MLIEGTQGLFKKYGADGFQNPDQSESIHCEELCRCHQS